MAEPADKTPEENHPPVEPAHETAAPAPPARPQADSVTFSRCAECRHAEDVNSAAGTLLCRKHSMLINAEADEIPDDCPDHEPKDG